MVEIVAIRVWFGEYDGCFGELTSLTSQIEVGGSRTCRQLGHGYVRFLGVSVLFFRTVLDGPAFEFELVAILEVVEADGGEDIGVDRIDMIGTREHNNLSQFINICCAT